MEPPLAHSVIPSFFCIISELNCQFTTAIWQGICFVECIPSVLVKPRFQPQTAPPRRRHAGNYRWIWQHDQHKPATTGTACGVHHKYITTSEPLVTPMSSTNSRAAKTMYIGLRDRKPTQTEHRLEDLVGPQSEQGFRLVEWEGRSSPPLTLWEKLTMHIHSTPIPILTDDTYNLEPRTVSFKHKDFANLSFRWCAVTALGSFNCKMGGHLILWDCHLVIEFPPRCTILLPSAILAHSNVTIALKETRYSFTQYTAGGLFRWVENGFQKSTDFSASLSEEGLED